MPGFSSAAILIKRQQLAHVVARGTCKLTTRTPTGVDIPGKKLIDFSMQFCLCGARIFNDPRATARLLGMGEKGNYADPVLLLNE